MSTPHSATRAPRVLIAGGGTGGHVCPAVAVALELKNLDPATEVLFLSTGREVERRILSEADLPFEVVAPQRVGGLLGLAKLASSGVSGLAKAFSACRRFKPDVALGLGGYGQAPGLLAARWSKVPYALFEPNAVIGRANRLMAGGAREIYVQFEASRQALTQPEKARLVGVPIRSSAQARLDPIEARRALGLAPQAPTLLITGGSQGAQALNNWAAEGIAKRRKLGWNIIHLTGQPPRNEALREIYHQAGARAIVESFSDSMGVFYAAADLVLCRAGGASIAEVTAAGRPSWVVPLPGAVDDHQRANARALGAAAFVCEQSSLNSDRFDELAQMLCEPERRQEITRASQRQGRPDAAQIVAQSLRQLAGWPRLTRSDSKNWRRPLIGAGV